MIIFILLSLSNLIAGIEYCTDNQYCNSHGVCTIEDSQKKCECVENTYTGEKCETMLKLCENDYCWRSTSCNDFPGGYQCVCEEESSGQNCSSPTVHSYKNPTFMFNVVTRLNVDEYFIVFFEEIPFLDIRLDLITYNYMMGSFLTSRREVGLFQETENIHATAKQYGIIDYEFIGGLHGHYVAVKYSLPKAMTYGVHVRYVNADINSELYFWEVFVRAYEPEAKCIPDIENYDCSNPTSPMSIAIDRQYSISPIIKRSCGINSKLTFSWSINDYSDTTVMYVFQGYTGRRLNLMPYIMLKVLGENAISGTSYVIRINVEEHNIDGVKAAGRSYFRCYIRVILYPPLVVIEGGTKRQVPVQSNLILSGTQSRDLSQPPTVSIAQTLTFSWTCESADDPANQYCAQLRVTQSSFTVPSNTLTITKSYKFTLTVKSIKTNQQNAKSQTVMITAQDENRLKLYVICLKNCQTPVSPNTELFLKGECFGCTNPKTAQYKWELEGADIGDRNRLILPANTLTNNKNYEIRLVVDDSNGENGDFFYGFETHVGIKTGYCEIEPETDGSALKTIFTLVCKRFSSASEPLEYHVYSNERLVATSFNSQFGFRVRNNDKSLLIKVYDRYGQLTTYNLNIRSTPIDIKTLAEYDWLAKDYDVQGTVILVDCLIDGLGTNAVNREDAIVFMLNTLKNIEYAPTTCDMELATDVLLKLLNAFEMDFDKAVLLFDVLGNYLNILHEFSWYTDAMLVTRDFIEILNTNYINIMDKVYTEFVPIPVENFEMYTNDVAEIKLYEDENYPDYPEFDSEGVLRILRLESIINKTEKLFPSINRILSKGLEVNEKAVLYDNEINIMKSYSVGDDDPDVFGRLEISVPKIEIMLEYEVFTFGKEITVNIKYFKDLRNTPFWWLPQSEKLFTIVFMLQLTERNTGSSIWNTNQPLIKYRYKSDAARRRRTVRTDVDTKPKIENVVRNRNDIVVYTLGYNKNELIMVNFETDSPNCLQIAFKPNSEPNYNDFHDANPFYLIDKTERLIRLQYEQSFKMYMGIILADDQDTSSDIKFSFTIESLACTQFDYETRRWCINNCRIAFNSIKTDINCSCTNQNTNLYSTYNKPKSIYYHNRYDREFLRRLPINLTIIVFVLVIVLFFILLLLLVVCRRRRNHTSDHIAKSSNVIATTSTTASDHNYLLTIVCGSNSIRTKVTTSNIGIQIYGDRGTSDQYILNLHATPFYDRNAEHIYQFVLKSAYDYGDITNLLLWIDYTGATPAFECDQIIISIYDRTYRFYVYDHLTLQYRNTNIIKWLNISDRNKLNFMKLLQRNYFRHNFIMNFYRNKIYLALLFLRIVLIMLVCALLMGRTTFDNYKDYRSVGINFLNILICIVIVVIFEKLIYYLYLKYMRT